MRTIHTRLFVGGSTSGRVVMCVGALCNAFLSRMQTCETFWGVENWTVANEEFKIFHVRQHHSNMLILSRKRCIRRGFAVFAFAFDLGEYLTAGLLELESKLFFYRISTVMRGLTYRAQSGGGRCY